MKRRIWGTAHKKKMGRTGCTSCGGHEFCQRQQARGKRTSRGKFGLMRWFCVCKNNNNNSKNSLRICWGKTNGEWSIVPDGPPAPPPPLPHLPLKISVNQWDMIGTSSIYSEAVTQVKSRWSQCNVKKRTVSFHSFIDFDDRSLLHACIPVELHLHLNHENAHQNPASSIVLLSVCLSVSVSPFVWRFSPHWFISRIFRDFVRKVTYTRPVKNVLQSNQHRMKHSTRRCNAPWHVHWWVWFNAVCNERLAKET